jgi:adenylate cyclase
MALRAVKDRLVERKLAAILAADVAGYSRLMGVDEEGTLARLKAHRRELIDPKIEEHRGHVVKLTGDGILIEFPSVVEAVRCAVDVQQSISEHNADVPKEQRIEFRVGINLGDVIAEADGDIYGDGVNIAARLETLAEPGSVYISGAAYEQVKNKLPFAYRFLGEQRVKNITEPVRVYRVCPEGTAGQAGKVRLQWPVQLAAAAGLALMVIVGGGLAGWYVYLNPANSPASATAPSSMPTRASTLPIPDKPSIAVLPFTNMSGDPTLDYFGDGVAEDLITELARYPELVVSGRNSTFFYKGKPITTRQVGQELGVRYVVEGSVRKSGDKVRITAQLIDATEDRNVWAQRYDEEGSDVFGVQDKVTQKVVLAISGEDGLIREAQHRLAWSKASGSLDEYDYALRVHSLIYRFNKADLIRARDLALEGLQRFPNSSFIRIKLAWCYFHLARRGWSDNPREDLERAFRLASEGLAGHDLPPLGQWHGHWLMSSLYVWYKRDFDAGLAEREATLALVPYDTETLLSLSQNLLWVGRPDEVIADFAKAAARDPHIPAIFYNNLGVAYHLKGQNEQALAELKRVSIPDLFNNEWRASVYAELGRWDEARAAVAEIRKVNPKITVASLREVLPFRDEVELVRHLDNLKKAGMPES